MLGVCPLSTQTRYWRQTDPFHWNEALANVGFPPIVDGAAALVRRRMTRLYRATFWAALVFVFVMALLPQPPQLPGIPSDKVQHVAAFATLAALGAAAYRSTSLMRFLVSLSALGAVIELLQAIPALNRDSDPVDWIADTGAAALVLVAMWWWRSKQEALAA